MWGSMEGSGVWIDAVGAVQGCSYVLHTVVVVIIIFVGEDGAGEVDGVTNVTQVLIYIDKNDKTIFYLKVSRKLVIVEKKHRGYST